MADQEQAGPIPEGILRVSIRYGGALFVHDLPAGQTAELVGEFESFAGPAIPLDRARGTWFGAEGANIASIAAAQQGKTRVMAGAALWLFLHRPGTGDRERPGEQLAHLIGRDGGAWLVCSADPLGTDWVFTLSPAGLSKHGEAGDPPLLTIPQESRVTVH